MFPGLFSPMAAVPANRTVLKTLPLEPGLGLQGLRTTRYTMKAHTFSSNGRMIEFDPENLAIKSIAYEEIHRPEESPNDFARNMVNSISINIAQKCNLNCTYCYADQGTYGNASEIKLQTGKDAIDWLLGQAPETREFALNFFGGEPLLQFATLKCLVSYTEELAQQKNIKFNYSITTNGTLLNDKIIAFFKKYDFSVNVSVDGPKRLHDKQRPFTSGAGSYDVLVPKLKKLLESGVHVSSRATIMDQTPESLVSQSLQDIGFKHITVTKASDSLFGNSRPVENADEIADILVAKEEARRLNFKHLQDEADQFLALIRNRDVEGIRGRKLNPKLYKNIFSLLTGKKKERFCGAGKNYAGISSKGEVYLCHRFVGQDAYKLGHTKDAGEKIKTIDDLQAELASGTSKCDSCFAKYLCGGGCYHDNLGKTGSLFEQHEDDCKIVRQTAQIAIALVAQLTLDDKVFLSHNNIVAMNFCPLDL